MNIIKEVEDRLVDELTKEINKRIVDRLFRRKCFKDPKKFESCYKHYLSKVLHKKRICQ